MMLNPSKLLSPILAVVLSWCLFELIAAAFLPMHIRRYVYMRTSNFLINNCLFLSHDGELGWLPKPHSHYSDRTREFNIDIAINSQGFRDDEDSLQKPDVLLLGDSYAFGCGVNHAERMDHFIENQLNAGVLTAGVPGYGTLQEMRLFRRWTTQHPGQTRAAVFVFYAGNDLTDNMGYGGIRHIPFVRKSNGTYTVVEPTREGFSDWVLYNRRTSCPEICRYSYAAFILYEFIRQLRLAVDRDNSTFERIDYSDKYDVFDFIVREIGNVSKSASCKVAFLYVPTVIYYEKDDRAEDDSEFNQVKKILGSNSLAIIDMRRILARADYYDNDGHWRQSGHRKAGKAISELIVSGGLLDGDRSVRPNAPF
jgi:hypothetical protein